MSMTIHPVLPQHAYAYTACHIACWQSAYRGIVPEAFLRSMAGEIEHRTAQMQEALNSPTDETHFYFAQINGTMAGRLIFCKSRDADKPEAGEIGAFYLLEAHWGQGYAQEMMRFAKNELRCGGYQDIILWVLEANARARRFYEKCGFVYDGARKEITVGKPLMEIRYICPLP